MRANSTQKAYDEAFLACSTAVYFESQNNEPEALRSWKSALDQIYYHTARRTPSNSRPTSETEKALVESLHRLELQCKERVDLLEALKRSREEANEKLTAPSPQTETNASTPPPHALLLAGTDSNASPSWLGGGTVPPVDYADLSRPPLPHRPSLPPRKSSGAESNHAKNVSQPSLSPEPAGRKESRTPSPEKKGRLLRTLRPGRESRPSAANLPTSMRSRPPEAAKAATQAWGFKPGSTAKAPMIPSQNASVRSCFERPASGIDSDRSSIYLRNSGSDLEVLSKPQRSRNPLPSQPSEMQSCCLDGKLGNQPTSAALPAYRNGYPSTTPNTHLLATSAATRSWTTLESGKVAPSRDTSSSRKLLTTPAQQSAESNRVQNPQNQHAESIALEQQVGEHKTQPPSRGKRKAKEDTMPAQLPPTPMSEVGNSECSDNETDEWEERVRNTLRNLPRGVDEHATRQILNEIVIQGDEVHWDDVAGLEVAKSALKETVVYPFLRPDLFMGLREPARGMLLFGPPGTGKTMLARAVATESKSTFFAISASSLTSKFLGESEKLVRALFAIAKMLAPSIIFVDEIDSLLSSRSGSGEHEATRRIKTEFLIQWSDLAKAAAGREQTDKDKEKGDASRVLVLAATNLPWTIDEAARRRFVRRQYIPLPEAQVRKIQIKTLLSHQKHELSVADLDCIVKLTEGFSGSDITALAKDAAMGPLRSLGEKLLHMTMDEIRPIRFEDFEASLRTIRPSVSKQGLKEYEDWAREFGERGG